MESAKHSGKSTRTWVILRVDVDVDVDVEAMMNPFKIKNGRLDYDS